MVLCDASGAGLASGCDDEWVGVSLEPVPGVEVELVPVVELEDDGEDEFVVWRLTCERW